MLTADKVEKVYTGKPGKCACGCSGNYWYPDHKNFAKMAKKVLDLLNHPDSSTEYDEAWASCEVDGRVYTAYLKEV